MFDLRALILIVTVTQAIGWGIVFLLLLLRRMRRPKAIAQILEYKDGTFGIENLVGFEKFSDDQFQLISLCVQTWFIDVRTAVYNYKEAQSVGR